MRRNQIIFCPCQHRQKKRNNLSGPDLLYSFNRKQKRHIRKNHINFLKTSWMAGRPWDTRPVSRQACPFLSVFSIVNNRKSPGHRPVDPSLSRRVSQGHPAGVLGIFLSLCALFFPDSTPFYLGNSEVVDLETRILNF